MTEPPIPPTPPNTFEQFVAAVIAGSRAGVTQQADRMWTDLRTRSDIKDTIVANATGGTIGAAALYVELAWRAGDLHGYERGRAAVDVLAQAKAADIAAATSARLESALHRGFAEARPNTPPAVIVFYLAVELVHALKLHDGDAQQRQPCCTAANAEVRRFETAPR